MKGDLHGWARCGHLCRAAGQTGDPMAGGSRTLICSLDK